MKILKLLEIIFAYKNFSNDNIFIWRSYFYQRWCCFCSRFSYLPFLFGKYLSGALFSIYRYLKYKFLWFYVNYTWLVNIVVHCMSFIFFLFLFKHFMLDIVRCGEIKATALIGSDQLNDTQVDIVRRHIDRANLIEDQIIRKEEHAKIINLIEAMKKHNYKAALEKLKVEARIATYKDLHYEQHRQKVVAFTNFQLQELRKIMGNSVDKKMAAALLEHNLKLHPCVPHEYLPKRVSFPMDYPINIYFFKPYDPQVIDVITRDLFKNVLNHVGNDIPVNSYLEIKRIVYTTLKNDECIRLWIARSQHDALFGNAFKVYSFFEFYALDKLSSQNIDSQRDGYMAGHICAALSVLNNANIHHMDPDYVLTNSNIYDKAFMSVITNSTR